MSTKTIHRISVDTRQNGQTDDGNNQTTPTDGNPENRIRVEPTLTSQNPMTTIIFDNPIFTNITDTTTRTTEIVMTEMNINIIFTTTTIIYGIIFSILSFISS